MKKGGLKSVFSIKRFLPTYTEVSLFLILLSSVLILIWHPQSRILLDHDYDLWDIREVMFIIAFLLGAYFSLYYALDFRKVPPREARLFMVLFVIFVEIMAALSLGMYNLDFETKMNAILATLNFSQAVLLIFLFRSNVINENNIKPYNAKPLELISGSFIVITAFFFMTLRLKMEWPTIFSILITYSVMFNDLLFTLHPSAAQPERDR